MRPNAAQNTVVENKNTSVKIIVFIGKGGCFKLVNLFGQMYR
jgi:hypothetical protein